MLSSKQEEINKRNIARLERDIRKITPTGGGGSQPLDATLTAIAALDPNTDEMIYFTALNVASVATFSAFGRSLVDDADAGAARTTLDAEQAFSKNSGFNLALGTSGGTVSEGDHLHTGVYEPADGTILKDADIGGSVQSHSAILDATTASFLVADETKLDGIEALADVTDAINVDAAGAVMESDISGTPAGRVIDDDTMATAADTTISTSESIKAYVDGQVASSVTYKGSFDPTGAGTPNLNTITSETGDMYTVTVAGTYNFTTGTDPLLEIGDVLIAEADGVLSNAGSWTIVQKNLDASSIKVAYESNADTNAFTDADVTKLGTIATNADVTSINETSHADVLVDSDIGGTVQAWDADLDIFAANGLTALELGQLQNINAVTISNTQWGFVGAFDQGLTTTSNVSFEDITASGNMIANGSKGVTIWQDATKTVTVGRSGNQGAYTANYLCEVHSTTDNTWKSTNAAALRHTAVEIGRQGFEVWASAIGSVSVGATITMVRSLLADDALVIAYMPLSTEDTTDSTSATTGALKSAGGLGVVKDIFSGGTLNPRGDTAVDDPAALGYTSSTGLQLTGKGSVNDITVKNSADANVWVVPTGTINVNFKGTIFIEGTTDSTTTTTGSIQTDGGLGVVKNIIGGALVKSGAGITGARPTPQGSASMWFDTTLGIPIWHDGTNWVDATGATV